MNKLGKDFVVGLNILPFPGCSTVTPKYEMMEDKIKAKTASPANKVTGCGNLFPTFSIRFKNPWKKDAFRVSNYDISYF